MTLVSSANDNGSDTEFILRKGHIMKNTASRIAVLQI